MQSSAPARPAGIGASDAAAIVGLNPYESAVESWLRMTGQVPPKDESEAMLWGHLLEPLLAEQLEAREDVAVMPAPLDAFFHSEHDWMFAHPDAFVEADGVRGLGEFKTGGWRQTQAWDDGVPMHFQVQAQHQMAVLALPFVMFAVLLGGQSFVVRRIERDEEAIQLIIERETRFWNLVQTNTPPPPDGSPASTDLLKRLYPQAAGGIVTLDHLGADLLERYQEARKHAKRWAEEEQAIENQVKAELKDADVGTLAGSPAFTWKSHLTHRLDQKALREELPDVFQVYNREVEQRRFVGVRR